MKKIYSLLIGLLFVGGAFAQVLHQDVKYTATPPEMDGFIEGTWDAATVVPLARTLALEVPTVTATWQALWDNDNFYVVVNVQDVDFWPAYVSGGNSWEYDKPEVYWDVNAVLIDGKGPATASSGHYQLSPGETIDGWDAVHTDAATTQSPGGSYAYSLTGENYVYEMAVPWANFKDADGTAMDATVMQTRPIGFDVTVIDQNEGITTARERAVWCQDEKYTGCVVDEGWNNMDGAGTINIIKVGVNTLKNNSMSVYPNPAIDNVTINADFNRVAISNILGQQIKTIAVKSHTINVSDLSKGVYVIKAYKDSKYVGTAKITKN